jgi:hypothetical protein
MRNLLVAILLACVIAVLTACQGPMAVPGTPARTSPKPTLPPTSVDAIVANNYPPG